MFNEVIFPSISRRRFAVIMFVYENTRFQWTNDANYLLVHSPTTCTAFHVRKAYYNNGMWTTIFGPP